MEGEHAVACPQGAEPMSKPLSESPDSLTDTSEVPRQRRHHDTLIRGLSSSLRLGLCRKDAFRIDHAARSGPESSACVAVALQSCGKKNIFRFACFSVMDI